MENSIKIFVTDITSLFCDCIVNAANSQLQMGGGVCGAIFRAAGIVPLQQACSRIGYCKTGNAVITPGFALPAKYVVHTVGPIWQGGSHEEQALLRSCYLSSLKAAREVGCQSIAFPLISSGIYGYPKEEAWETALQAVLDYQTKDPDLQVTFSVLDPAARDLGTRILHSLMKGI